MATVVIAFQVQVLNTYALKTRQCYQYQRRWKAFDVSQRELLQMSQDRGRYNMCIPVGSFMYYFSTDHSA